jgi:hypothetical protein
MSGSSSLPVPMRRSQCTGIRVPAGREKKERLGWFPLLTLAGVPPDPRKSFSLPTEPVPLNLV